MKRGTMMSDADNSQSSWSKDRPRAGWDDCEISDTAWEKVMDHIKERQAQKAKMQTANR